MITYYRSLIVQLSITLGHELTLILITVHVQGCNSYQIGKYVQALAHTEVTSDSVYSAYNYNTNNVNKLHMKTNMTIYF